MLCLNEFSLKNANIIFIMPWKVLIRWQPCHRFAEFGASGTILTAKYNLDSLMLRYQGLDWRDEENWDCNARVDPLQRNAYDGTSINPLEVSLKEASWPFSLIASC